MSKRRRVERTPSRADHPLRRRTVAVVGGDGRRPKPDLTAVEIQSFPSSKYGGNGRHQNTLAAIRSGSFELVLMLVRWLGHSDSRAIALACHAAGIPCRVVAGGMTAAMRDLRDFIDGEVPRVR
jgi:hypothetical protein